MIVSAGEIGAVGVATTIELFIKLEEDPAMLASSVASLVVHDEGVAANYPGWSEGWRAAVGT